MTCTCGKLSIGDSYNWNPDCSEHGTHTEWYKGEGGNHLRDQNIRAVYMQGKASGVRKNAAEVARLQAEVSRLRAFVAAFDAYNVEDVDGWDALLAARSEIGE